MVKKICKYNVYQASTSWSPKHLKVYFVMDDRGVDIYYFNDKRSKLY